MQLEIWALGVLVSSYCCSTYRIADPFSSLGAFSSFSIGGPVFHLIDDCEHPLLYLPGTGIASYETAITGSLQQNLSGICNNVILSEVTQSQKNTHDMHSLISRYYSRNLEYPRYNLQNTWNSRRRKTKVWILRPSLEWGTKYPWKELQRQRLELRWKDGLSRDYPTQGSIP